MDTSNKHMVGVMGQEIVIMNPPRRLSKDDALMFAAWIVALAEYEHDGESAFQQCRDAVESICQRRPAMNRVRPCGQGLKAPNANARAKLVAGGPDSDRPNGPAQHRAKALKAWPALKSSRRCLQPVVGASFRSESTVNATREGT